MDDDKNGDGSLRPDTRVPGSRTVKQQRKGSPGLGIAIGCGCSAILWAVIAAIVYAVFYG